MKKARSELVTILLLVIVSIALYVLQLFLFHSPRETAFYVLQDIAFLPIQVALVTVILGRYVNDRNKRVRLNKINMVIDAFFSEAGTAVLIELAGFADNIEKIKPTLAISQNWSDSDFSKTANYLKTVELHMQCSLEKLVSLKTLLMDRRDFFLRMLENPNLLEHDSFTDMLFAVFHITEELLARDDFSSSSKADIKHLEIDAERALRALIVQWIYHIRYLNLNYPYLYSLEVRRNPFGNAKSISLDDEETV